MEPTEEITYTVVVTNTGGTEVTGPVVDTLPDGFTVDEASISDNGTLSGDTITWNVTLAADESKTLTYKGTVERMCRNGAHHRQQGHVPRPEAHDPARRGARRCRRSRSAMRTTRSSPSRRIEDLADTGANNVGNLVGAALLAMIAGGLMVTFGRRRREE